MGRLSLAGDLAKTVVTHRGDQSILLGQVATVTEGNPPAIGEGIVNDKVGMLMVIEKYPEANTLDVTRRLEQAIEAIRPGLPGVEITTRIFRPASFIEQAIGNLRHAMLFGCILVAIIVVGFLFE